MRIFVIYCFFILFSYNLKSNENDNLYSEALELAYSGNYVKSNELLYNLIDKTKNDKDLTLHLDCYISIGYNYSMLNQNDNAIKLYADAIYILNKNQFYNFKNINYLYKNYANQNSIVGNHIIALKYYKKCLENTDINKDIDLYLDFKICIATEKYFLDLKKEALENLNDIYMLVMNKDYNSKITKKNLLSFLLNISEINLDLKNFKNSINYNTIIRKNYLSEILEDYYFGYNFLQFKFAKDNILNQNIDSLYNQIDFNKLNEFEQNEINTIYNLYKYRINKDKTYLSKIEKSILYFENINNYKKVIELYIELEVINTSEDIKTLMKFTNFQKYIEYQKKQLNHALIYSIELENKLDYLKSNLEKEKYMSNIYLILSICLFSIVVSLIVIYFKQKNINKLKDIDFDNNLKLNNVKVNLTNNILDLQKFAFVNLDDESENNEENKLTMINIINNLHKLHKNI